MITWSGRVGAAADAQGRFPPRPPPPALGRAPHGRPRVRRAAYTPGPWIRRSPILGANVNMLSVYGIATANVIETGSLRTAADAQGRFPPPSAPNARPGRRAPPSPLPIRTPSGTRQRATRHRGRGGTPARSRRPPAGAAR